MDGEKAVSIRARVHEYDADEAKIVSQRVQRNLNSPPARLGNSVVRCPSVEVWAAGSACPRIEWVEVNRLAMDDHRSHFLGFMDRLGFVACCGMAASFTISRALFNVFSLLLLICWIGSGRFFSIGQDLKQSPLAAGCFALVLWIAFGLVYAQAPLDRAGAQVLSYSKILLVPILISFLDTRDRVRRFSIAALTALTALLALYIADLWIDIPWSRSAKSKDIGVFNNYIVEGLSFGVLGITALAISFEAHQRKNIFVVIPFATLSALAIYTVFFLNPGRGAQLAAGVGLAILVMLIVRLRLRWLIGIAVLCGVVLMASQSDVSKARFGIAFQQLQSSSARVDESILQRLGAWSVGFGYWSNRPLLGYGPGAYRELAFADRSGRLMACQDNPACEQPHSQYVLFMVEQGGVGLGLFVFILATLIWPALRRPSPEAALAAAFAGLFAVHSVFDSGLRMGTQMFVFIVVASALAARLRLASDDRP